MADVLDLAPVEKQTIQSDGAAITRRASELVIIDADGYALGTRIAQEAKAAIGVVKEKLDPIVQKAHEAHRALTKLRGDLLSPFESAINNVNAKRKAFDDEQERRRRAEEDRLRKLAEDDARKARDAEIAEAKRIADAAKAEADAAKAAGDAERAKRLAEEAKEARAMTRELKSAPVEFVAPVVAQTQPKVEGSTRRKTFKAEIADMFVFVRWCAAAPERMQYLIANAHPLNTFARNYGRESDGSATSIMPGIKIKEETSYSDRKAF